jgi:hypothetical protein
MTMRSLRSVESYCCVQFEASCDDGQVWEDGEQIYLRYFCCGCDALQYRMSLSTTQSWCVNLN